MLILIFTVSFSLTVLAYNESPELAVKVAAGELPSVDERLPESPLVVKPYDQVGEYGGTMRRVWMGPGDKWGLWKFARENLVQWDREGKEIVANIAESFSANEDMTVWTFKLRKGMKWSDGQPFTTEDIQFWYEDIILNEELTPTVPARYKKDGKPMELIIVDEYTFKTKFASTYANFPQQIAYFPLSWIKPKHYLKQFHPEYVDKEQLQKKAEEQGFDEWYQLFQDKDIFLNPDIPSLWAWTVENNPDSQIMVMKRNPYYWKVDTAGNQLPYIDQIDHSMINDKKMIDMMVLQGEIDFQGRHVESQNYYLYMENRDIGNYDVYEWVTGTGANTNIMFNQNVQDPVLKEIFRKPEFRQAMSLGINREEVNLLVHDGRLEARQASLISGSPYFDPEWEKAYAEYNPELANKMLDELGLEKRNGAGIRLLPNGKPFNITIEMSTSLGGVIDTVELVKQYWEDLGVNAAIKTLERSLYTTRSDSGLHQVGIWKMDRAFNPVPNPIWIIPTEPNLGHWGTLYANWYQSNGEKGEEPTPEIKQLYDIWEKIKMTNNPDEIKEYMKEITKIHRENIWNIGVCGEATAPIIVSKKLRNVPEQLTSDDILRTPANARPQQFYFEQ